MDVLKTPASEFTPDPPQTLALEHVHGPMLVIAGAGTGKTTVLTQRIARLIGGGHAKAEEILALTYSDNSAAEMAKRVAEVCPVAKDLQARTFHSYCFELLNRNKRGFDILDDYDLNILLRKRIHDLNLKHYVRAAKPGEFLKDLIDFMKRCQDELVTPAQYSAYVERLARGEAVMHRVAKSAAKAPTKTKDSKAISEEEALARCREIDSVFQKVESWLTKDSLGTFGHMITRAVELLQSEPDVLAREQARAHFILADEFQDTNFAQIRLLALLAGKDANIFAVGDPDQAIYRFRGASSGAFDIFLRQFSGTRVIRLDRNRRSLTPILQCAHAIIDQNPPIFRTKAARTKTATRVEDLNRDLPNQRQPLVSVREEDAVFKGQPLRPELVEIVACDKEPEAEDVAIAIRARKELLACPWGEMAVLYRTHSHREEVVRQLATAGIPFFVHKLDVFDTPEVRDLLACAGAVVDPSDSVSLFRVAALPESGIAPLELNAVMRTAARGTALHRVLPDIPRGSALLAKLAQVRAEISQKSCKSAQALRVLAKRFQIAEDDLAIQGLFGFAEVWEKKKTPIVETGELGELLQYLPLFREAGGKIPVSNPPQGDAVQLMSAHAAKGLEFEHVFILRVRSGSFPSNYKEPLVEFPQELRDPDSMAEGDSKELQEQEERRLFYVAMTRAKDTLTLYGRPGTGKDTSPPKYLRELLQNKSLQAWRRQREPQALLIDLEAAEATETSMSLPSPLAAWFALPLPPPAKRSLSASAIESYERCPLQFKLSRDWRIPDEAPAALQYGSAMHLALRHYYDAVRFERPVTTADVVQIFRDEFAKAAIAEDYQRELYEQQGIRQLEAFIAAAEGNLPNVLHTEQEFEVEIGGIKVSGRIDRIDRLEDGSVRIVDYKTGEPKSEKYADESLQLSIYALAAARKWDYKASALMLQNLKDGSMAVTRRDEKELAEATEQVREAAANIAAEKFEAKPGFHCSWCAYRSLCPATENSLPLPHNVSPVPQ
jgi:DNA helicase-2/ATP-dependent DNA helicase PcrA